MSRSVSIMCLWFDTRARALKSESIFSCVSIFYFIFSGCLSTGCVCVCIWAKRIHHNTQIAINIRILYPFTCPVCRYGHRYLWCACIRIRHVSFGRYIFVHVIIIIIGAISFHPHQLKHPIYRFQYVANNMFCCCWSWSLDCWLLA